MGVSVGSRGGFEELSKSEIFDVLRNERRRYLLHYLETHDPPAELGDLATRIAAWEYETPVEAVTSEQRKRVYTTLQQTHLPKMDEAEIVEYDSDRGLVRATEHTEKLNVYLEIVPHNEFPWREYYLSLGAVFSGLVAALYADVQPFAGVDTLTWAALAAAVLTLSAAVHVLVERRMQIGATETPQDID